MHEGSMFKMALENVEVDFSAKLISCVKWMNDTVEKWYIQKNTHSLDTDVSCNRSIKMCHHFTVGYHHLACIHPITNNKCGYNIAGSYFIDRGNHCEHWSNLVKWRNVGPFSHLKIIINVGPFSHLKIIIHVLYSRAYFKMVELSKPVITHCISYNHHG